MNTFKISINDPIKKAPLVKGKLQPKVGKAKIVGKVHIPKWEKRRQESYDYPNPNWPDDNYMPGFEEQCEYEEIDNSERYDDTQLVIDNTHGTGCWNGVSADWNEFRNGYNIGCGYCGLSGPTSPTIPGALALYKKHIR